MSGSLKYKTSSVSQYMIANGCVKSEDFRAMLIKMMGLNVASQLDDDKVRTVVEQTNKKLDPFKMKIRAKIDEGTADKYYVLISTVDNEITRAASHYSPKEFELFKLTLEAIANNPAQNITEDHYIELAEKATISTTCKTRSQKAEHKVLLDEWCDKRWLTLVANDDNVVIRLGVRSRAELDVIVPDGCD